MLILSATNATPMYLQIAEQYRSMIMTGQLNTGDNLPSISDISAQLVISQHHIVKAFEFLETQHLVQKVIDQKWVVSSIESGTQAEKLDRIHPEILKISNIARKLGLELTDLYEAIKIQMSNA